MKYFPSTELDYQKHFIHLLLCQILEPTVAPPVENLSPKPSKNILKYPKVNGWTLQWWGESWTLGVCMWVSPDVHLTRLHADCSGSAGSRSPRTSAATGRGPCTPRPPWNTPPAPPRTEPRLLRSRLSRTAAPQLWRSAAVEDEHRMSEVVAAKVNLRVFFFQC